ncbi:kinase-like protein [Aureobasidium subglaciale]|nr:kinase-like protein [Aureobasidium subglaciale]
MQGLQIRTPANAGSYKIEQSKNGSEDTEMLTPPSTPAQAKLVDQQFPSRRSLDASHVPELNFTPDWSQAQLLGEGVWSKHYAIKTATRSDATAVFQAEARILTHVQNHDSSSDYVVPFHGLCTSTQPPSLLFHCCDAGTLESLTETSSSLSLAKVLDLFLHVLPQLTHALSFLHNRANTIHADIKPANILLDVSASGLPFARFADFSTAFVASSEPSAHSGGGTWSFMSPEQLSRDPSTSAPSFSSDVYALGVTLLSFLCGGNPFASMLNNGFRLREAVKMGDAMSWAMQEPEFENRIEALQKLWTERGGEGKILSLVACALRKKKEDRFDAEAWCAKVDAALGKLKKVDMVGLGIRC